ncbi:MAG: orotidine-5'-phosphate decarboxylase [Aquificota bacterium]|nr:MAG: orotidine-5'-phosphate decarboxylase [Aquificota bacterium]
MEKKLAFALDVKDLNQAYRILEEISGFKIIIKIGYVLFIKGGKEFIKHIKESGLDIFLDLKLHDIPNTVYNGVSAAKDLGVDYLTIHTLGGVDMIKKAVEAKNGSNLKLLGVTILTSHDENYVKYIGTKYTIKELTLHLAKEGIDNGLDGIVCSSHEVKEIKEKIKKDFIAVVPGIRLKGGESEDDQSRISTPKQAIQQGADIIVVGRPILNSENRKEIIKKILKEL